MYNYSALVSIGATYNILFIYSYSQHFGISLIHSYAVLRIRVTQVLKIYIILSDIVHEAKHNSPRYHRIQDIVECTIIVIHVTIETRIKCHQFIQLHLQGQVTS